MPLVTHDQIAAGRNAAGHLDEAAESLELALNALKRAGFGSDVAVIKHIREKLLRLSTALSDDLRRLR